MWQGVSGADLCGGAEELAEDALLHVLQLPDAGSNAGRQLLVDVGVGRQRLQPPQKNYKPKTPK